MDPLPLRLTDWTLRRYIHVPGILVLYSGITWYTMCTSEQVLVLVSVQTLVETYSMILVEVCTASGTASLVLITFTARDTGSTRWTQAHNFGL